MLPGKFTSLTDTTITTKTTRLYSKSDSCLLVFGNGNVANAVLSGFASNIITGTTIKKYLCTFRNERPRGGQTSGVQYIEFSRAWEYLDDCTHILITIPPSMSEDLSTYSDPVLDNASVISNLPQNVWIGYVSTTGVYGNHNGAVVNESSLTLCKPMTKAFAYLDIEKRWQNLQKNVPSRRLFIFRCSGLYGNSLSALHTVLRNGIEGGDESINKILPSQEVLTSRVHLEDVSRTIIALMEQTSSKGGIYNLADSFPATRREVMQYAKGLLLESNVTIPEREKKSSCNASERKKRRTSDRKIVSNDKMKGVLNTYGGLLFPSYREGLRQILQKNLAHWKQL
jgi:nucleoside-diphosphate-sugar epimerase